jgi:hypothetical protein
MWRLTVGVHVLHLPNFHPTLLNRVIGRHWIALHRAKAHDACMYQLTALQQGIPRAAGPRKVHLTVSGWSRGGRLPDADAALKVLLDALVQAGLLLDDGPCGLVGSVQVQYLRGPRHTTIRLEDVLERP